MNCAEIGAVALAAMVDRLMRSELVVVLWVKMAPADDAESQFSVFA
jgi:hypothetical protein